MKNIIINNIKKLKSIIDKQTNNFNNILEEERKLKKELEDLGIEEFDNTNSNMEDILKNKILINKEELNILNIIQEEINKNGIDIYFEDKTLNKRLNLVKKILFLEYDNNVFELLILSEYGLYYIKYKEGNVTINNLSTNKNGYHIFENGEICDGTWINIFKKIDEISIISFIELLDTFLNNNDGHYHLANKDFNKDFLQILKENNKILLLKGKLNKVKNKNITEILNNKELFYIK